MTAPKGGTPQRAAGRMVADAQDYLRTTLRARQRDTLIQAERYSVFVRIMKRALPLAALALALAVVVYALQPRETGRVEMSFERMGTIENDLAMVNPKLTGTDDKGLPFTVSARQAVQEGRGSKRVRLEDIRADLAIEDGSRLRLTAAEGLVDTDSRQLDISGGIRFETDDGLTGETASATADLKTGIVSGNQPVTTNSKMGRITAKSFSYDKDNRKLQFAGGVRMLVSGAKR
jgi:lipopolysaccharide export system protein LptC